MAGAESKETTMNDDIASGADLLQLEFDNHEAKVMEKAAFWAGGHHKIMKDLDKPVKAIEDALGQQKARLAELREQAGEAAGKDAKVLNKSIKEYERSVKALEARRGQLIEGARGRLAALPKVPEHEAVSMRSKLLAMANPAHEVSERKPFFKGLEAVKRHWKWPAAAAGVGLGMYALTRNKNKESK